MSNGKETEAVIALFACLFFPECFCLMLRAKADNGMGCCREMMSDVLAPSGEREENFENCLN